MEDDYARLLVEKLQSLEIQCDEDMAKEFVADEDNREAIESKFLRKMFLAFKENKVLLKEKEEERKEKEEERERAEKAEKEKEEERERAEKAEKENKNLKEEVAEADMAPFVKRKFPPLTRGSGITEAHVNRVHKEAELTIKEGFELLKDEQLPMERKVPFSLQSRTWSHGELSFTKEASVVSIIETLLWEARQWLGQNLSIQTEYGIAGGRPDIVVIMGRLGTPVGAIEVKVPNADPNADKDEPMGNKRLHGQLLDYLQILHHVYGVEHPLGIASTYTSWRFCWLPGSEEFVKTTKKVELATKEELNAKVSIHPLVASIMLDGQDEETKLAAVPTWGTEIPNPPNLPKENKEQRQENRNISKLPRELHGTEVLAYDHPELPRHIVSFLHKLTYVEVLRRPITEGWFYPYVGPSQFDWAELKTLPVPGTFPANNTKFFWLLSELGAGQEGKAWKATTSSGATCAIKVFDRNADLVRATERRDEELKNWKEVWDIKQVFDRELLGRPAMVMPLVMTAPSFGINLPNDLPQQLKEATLRALERLDGKGFKDDDLAWRHVGFYNHDGYKAVLLDIQKQDKTQSSLSDMKNKLGLV